jgi:hypothetical protein
MADALLAKARELCTAAELRLVRSSGQPALGKLGEAQLKKNVALARKLRDKWRDVTTRQRRRVQGKRGAREADKDTRSRRKSELFTEVLARFESQLGRVTASRAADAPTRPVAKSPTKKKRVRGHRRVRSATREQLGEQVKERRAAQKRATQALPPKSSTGPDRYGSKGAATAANRARFKTSGLDTRIRGHVSARGRRVQARRDARS